MFEEILDDQKTGLAFAIAKGESVADWAEENDVPRSTAFRWARETEVRNAVNLWRRELLDQAIGRMARRATMAADGIAGLAEGARSESVQLRAWRAILADQMSVAKFSVLEQRMVEIEEHIQSQRGDPAYGG